jgi:hypothetical protein
MSIIHDALKKVQNGKQSSPDGNGPVSGAPDASQPVPGPASDRPKEPSPAIPKPVLISLMAVVSIVVIALLFILLGLARQTSIHPTIVPETPPLKVSVSVASPTQPAPPLEQLKLEGIMNMGEKKVALINGSIYEEGQTVDGMTVVKVTESNVTVLENGVEKVLKIKQ